MVFLITDPIIGATLLAISTNFFTENLHNMRMHRIHIQN